MLTLSQASYAVSDKACAIVAIHKEAGGESLQGRRSILDIIRNRMRRDKKTACQVVTEPAQFSSYHVGMSWYVTSEMRDSYEVVSRMHRVLDRDVYWFYNRRSVRKPSWAAKMIVAKRVGWHNFLKLKGGNK